jgi:ATP-dependent DNA helicase RecG
MDPEQLRQIISMGEGYQAEFKISVPSKPREIAEEVCAFANASGGTVVLGVSDDNDISGVAVDNRQRSVIQDAIGNISPALRCTIETVELDNRELCVIEVPSGKMKPYVYSGAIYIRIGPNSQKLTTAEEMREFFQRSDRIFFDEGECSKFNPEKHLDREIYDLFKHEAGLSPVVPDGQIFGNLRLKSEEGFFRNGAVLFFGAQPEVFFEKAYTRCVRFDGYDKRIILDDKIFGGPLFRQYQSALIWLKGKLDVRYDIEGQGSGPRKEIWEIPEIVFKETIINALSHRDYYEKGAVTTVELFDDRIEVSNPGGLVSAISKEEFGHKSFSRNPLIFGLFNRMRLVEQIGSGIPRIREMMQTSALPEPEFRYKGMFTVALKRPVNWAILRTHYIKLLSARQIKILDVIYENPNTTKKVLSGHVNVSTTSIDHDIVKLKKIGVLSRTGSNKKGIWIIHPLEKTL